MNTKKKTLAVLFGGHSSEYEVSLQSAAAVLEAVDTERFDPLVKQMNPNHRFKARIRPSLLNRLAGFDVVVRQA